MAIKTTAAVITAIFILICSLSCRKSLTGGKMPTAGIALTFDDNYVDDWYKYLNFFDSFHVKVTFYISQYHKLTEDQKMKLMTLKSHGHEIAYHSLNHPDFVKYLQQHSMGQLEEEEITKGLKMMQADGINPLTFAYPYGSHNEVLDNCILRTFKSVRYLNGTKDYAKSFVKNTSNSELYAIGIDASSGKSDNQLIEFEHLAQQNDDCVVFVGHHINRKEFVMGVSDDRIRLLVQKAIEMNLIFYTVSEISKP
jgi:peptidoglycan/xylan/chitin deacetylase (PgdA/CDA1 family)